ERLLDPARITRRQAADELAHLAFGNGAHETVDGPAVLEGDHGGDGLDSELPGNGRMLVDIEFGELHAPARLAYDLFKHRGQLLAWAAPGRPEIDQNRLAARFLDNVGGERGCGNVLYDVRALRGRLASAGTSGCAPVGPSVQASEGDVHFACAGVVRI